MYSLAHKAGPKGEENQVVWGRRELWWIWSWFFKPHLYRIITCYSNRWSGGGVYSSLTPIDFLQLQSLLIVKLKKRLIFLFLIFHVMIYLLPLFRCFALCWGLLRHWGWGGGSVGGGNPELLSPFSFSFSIFLILPGDCVLPVCLCLSSLLLLCMLSKKDGMTSVH